MKTMRRGVTMLAGAAVLAVVTAAPGLGQEASSPATLTPVDFRLNWVIAGNHAPFFLAKQEGFWSACGLDVSMAAGQGSGDTAQQVGNGTQEFGLTDAVSIVAGASRGLPVQSFGVLYQTNPSALVSKKAAGITTLQDVAGKTWGAVPGGSPYLLLKALFKANGIEDSAYREVTVPAPGIAQLLADQVNFITFFGNEVANIDPDAATNLNVLPFAEFGQDIYGLALASNPTWIAENPALVSCFIDGVKQGFAAAAANPEAALDALEAANPETAERRAVHAALLQGAFDYAGTDLLAQDLARWEATQAVLVDAGIVETPVDVSTVFTTVTE